MVRSIRGVTAMLFVVALLVTGAQPAAAEGLGWRAAWDWLAGLWGAVVLQGGDCGPEIDPNGCPDTPDAGPEIDPSGGQAEVGLEIDPDGGPKTTGDCGFEIDPSGVPRCKPAGSAS